MLIEKMNSILSDWAASFDNLFQVQMKFAANEEGKICLNELPIHMPTDLSLSSACFDTENIKFYFNETRKMLWVGIAWPEDSVPEVDTIRFGYEALM